MLFMCSVAVFFMDCVFVGTRVCCFFAGVFCAFDVDLGSVYRNVTIVVLPL